MNIKSLTEFGVTFNVSAPQPKCVSSSRSAFLNLFLSATLLYHVFEPATHKNMTFQNMAFDLLYLIINILITLSKNYSTNYIIFSNYKNSK